MKRQLATLGAVLAVFAAGAGRALAADPVQSTTQSAGAGQAAIAASSATQVQPANAAYSVRVLSPGDDGAVTQSNTASSSATATNSAAPTQTAYQTQSSDCDCSVPSALSIAKAAEDGRLPDVVSGAMQLASASDPAPSTPASRSAVPSGTRQSNDAASTGSASNSAPTTQSSSQAQASGGTQSTTQSVSTKQIAGASSAAAQDRPANTSISVRVLSPGDDGAVTQSNTDTSQAAASNDAPVSQSGRQIASGPSLCGCGTAPAVQALGQSSRTGQLAGALSAALQQGAQNVAAPVRIWSDGGDGSVLQSNAASSSATATNAGATRQTASQEQAGRGIQALGQDAQTNQASGAWSIAAQLPGIESCGCEGPAFGNLVAPVRIGSVGDGGPAAQANDATSRAGASNAATPTQGAEQLGHNLGCGCGGPAVQALGQRTDTAQLAGGVSDAVQLGPTNRSLPVSWSPLWAAPPGSSDAGPSPPGVEQPGVIAPRARIE